MNKKFSKKATSLLLISHLTLSALPITAMAVEDSQPSTSGSQEIVDVPSLMSENQHLESSTSNYEESTENDKTTAETSEREEPLSSIELKDESDSTSSTHDEATSENTSDSSEKTEEDRAARSIVQVSSDAELRSALSNANVTHISLSNNITMTTSVTWLGTTKTIEGNGNTLTFGNNVFLYGNTVNQGLNIRNVRIVSSVANAIYQNRTSSVSFTNVTHLSTLASSRLLVLNGANSSVNFFGINHMESGALIWATSGVRMNVDSGSSLKVNNTGTATSIHFPKNGEMNLSTNSSLEISQNNPVNTVKTVLIEGATSRVNIASGATLSIASAPDTQKTQDALSVRGALTVADGGTLDVVGRSVYSTVNVGQSSTFYEGSNIRIQNNHPNGPAIGSFPGTTNYTIHSSKGMQTWARGTDFSEEPTFNYQTFNHGSFSLNYFTIKQVTSQIQSNDAMFNATFNSAQIGKIITGGFVDSNSIQQTTIDKLTTESTHITGRAESNASISIEIEGHSTLSGRVAGDGTYQFTIPNAPLSAGTKVTAIVTANGLTSSAETIVQGDDVETISETTISELNTDSTSVTGTAEPNSEITIKDGDITLAKGRVGSDGVYALGIERQQAGTVVTAQAQLNSVYSNIAETTVLRATIMETTLNDLTTLSTTISGTAEPNSQVEITIGDSDPITATTDNNGNFNMLIDPLPEGTVITAQANMDDLKSNIASTVVTKDPADTKGTITPDNFNVSTGGQFLTGSYTGDVVSARVYVNGVSIRGGNFRQGRFEFFVGNRIASVDDKVEIQALDANGRVLDRKSVTLEKKLIGTITPDTFRVGDRAITGTFSGDVNFARVIINGTPTNAWGGTFHSDGTFSFYVANLNITVNDKVEIQALNRQVSGNSETIEVLETREVSVIDQLRGTITPDTYHFTDTSITGTFTGDINFANLLIDGQSVNNWGGTFNKETGRFEFFVHAQFREAIRNGAKVELQTYHRATSGGEIINHRLVRQSVEVVKLSGSITPEPFKVTNRDITGSFDGDINFANLIIDGQSFSWGGSFDSNTNSFTYFVNQTGRDLIRDAEKVELVGYNRGVLNGRPVDTELYRSTLKIDRDFIGTITPNDYLLGSRVLTGTYTGRDINFGRLEIDGVTLWVSSFSDGEFTAYLNADQAAQITKDSEMTIFGIHRFPNLSTEIIAESSVNIVE